MLLELLYNNTGLYIFNSRPFSTALATIISYLTAIILFPVYIRYLKSLHFSSEFNTDEKKHDPVMPAGILFLIIIISTVLITVRFNSYVISALIIYTFFSLIGAADDIAKVINKRRLLQGKITKQDYQYKADGISATLRLSLYILISLIVAIAAYKYIPNISGSIAVPFFSIEKIFPYLPFWLFIPLMTFTIAVSANGVNFTDGFDTLSAVPLILCFLFVAAISYVSSNTIWSSYLLIPNIPGLEEILPLIGAVIGTLLAFFMV